MATNYNKLLDEALILINRSLTDIFQWEIEDLKRKDKSIWSINKLKEKKEKNLQKIRELNEENQKLWIDISNADKYINAKELREAWAEWITFLWRQSSLNAFKKLKWWPIHLNYINQKDISIKYKQMMALAVTTKEKRNILFSLYNMNWKSVWVMLPVDMDIESISIKDWLIVTNHKQLSN